mmetsp:Transcript_10839/g.29510  ORF Transcript_10839/g.29510 Transcript_10839/m.29510 type:complete len:201 (-) Transcript_10839:949-1551(-)
MLHTPSSRERSWLTTMTVPAKLFSSCSSESTVTASRSLVGSSRSSTLGRCDSTRSSWSLRRSPPDSMSTSVCHRARSKLTEASRRAAAASRVSPGFAVASLRYAASSAISETNCMTRCLGSGKTGGSCVRKPMRTASPKTSSPPASSWSPDSVRKKVDLPAPFGPTMPTLLPLANCMVTWSRMLPRRGTVTVTFLRPTMA